MQKLPRFCQKVALQRLDACNAEQVQADTACRGRKRRRQQSATAPPLALAQRLALVYLVAAKMSSNFFFST